MSSAALLRPVARRTLPVRTEAELLAGAGVGRRPLPARTDEQLLVAAMRPASRFARHHGPNVPADPCDDRHDPSSSGPERAPGPDGAAEGRGLPASPEGEATASRTTTSRAPAARGGATLDEVLSGAWEALTAHAPAPCPICGGALRPRFGSGADVVGGRCTGCSTTLR